MTEPPRRTPPTAAEMQRNALRQHAQGSMLGWSRQTRPYVQATTPATAGAMGFLEVVEHGDDGTVGRPNVQWVLWVGAATPANALPYDGWYTADVTP